MAVLWTDEALDNIAGIYFSGTGNTRHCTYEFLKAVGDTAPVLSIEDPSAEIALKENDFIVFAYPVYFSNIPMIVRDFIERLRTIIKRRRYLLSLRWGSSAETVLDALQDYF